MSDSLRIIIIMAHFSMYLLVPLLIWIFQKNHRFYQEERGVRSLALVYAGLACLMVSSSFEIAEHAGDMWVYMSQFSFDNQMFYTFLNMGFVLMAFGLANTKKLQWVDYVLVLTGIAVPILYSTLDTKNAIQGFALIALLTFIYRLYVVLQDKRVFLFPILTNVVQLAFGIILIQTEQQFWHVFVAGTAAVALLFLSYLISVAPQRLASPLPNTGTV